MSHVIALDQGTTSSRAIVFDHDGNIAGQAQKEFEQFFPQSGWVEHDPAEIWSTQSGVIGEAVAAADISSDAIEAIGITNQRETTIIWDRKTGEPVHRAIVWQDRRTASYVDRLKADGLGDMVQERTGLVLDAYFSASKIVWLLDNVDGVRERAEKGELAFGTVDSFLIWKLTGGEVHVTDVSNACRTMLYNLREGRWDTEVLEALDIPESLLPEVRSSSEVYGHANQGQLRTDVPIAGILGDQQAASFGQVCYHKGQGKNTYGTGCFFLMNMGQEPVPSENDLLSTIAWQLGDRTDYALEGSIYVAGAVVQWLRDGLKLIRDSSEVEDLARSVDDNGGVYLVPAFAGLGAPHWDQYARGAIVGLSRGSSAGHVARAALEGIAYQVADVAKAMEADSGEALTELRVDGGATANDLLMQFQADLLGVPVVRPKITETTALGAAYVAGLAVDFWDGLEQLEELWEEERRFEPDMADERREELMGRWHDALERSKNWEKSDDEG